MKLCKKCGLNPKIKWGSYCRLCKNEFDLKSYHKNKSKRSAYIKKYRDKNPLFKLKGNQTCKEWRKNNPFYIKEWNKEKMKTDVGFRIRHNLSERLRLALKSNSKGKKTMELLGCSIIEFKIHLESKFQEGMNWSNYGLKGWHIDHIKPCALFDLTKSEEQIKCFHYTNMQPLWSKDNLTKSKTFNGD
jgi:hypothetical protein